jgi:iron complex outermembrane receptor protein
LKLQTFSLTAGHSYQSFEYDNSSSESIEYLNSDGTVNLDTSITQSFIDKSKNVLLSYFGRANYSINEKYLITATLRADASSKLPSEDRWGTFFSTALAWNIHKESAGIENIFNELKLRLGYGRSRKCKWFRRLQFLNSLYPK